LLLIALDMVEVRTLQMLQPIELQSAKVTIIFE